MAEAVVRALADYIGVAYTPPIGQENDYYVVKKGDSLYAIARKYGITLNALKDANNLTSNNLAIGQVLKIPTTSENEIITDNKYYTVVAGDTLYKIAGKYNLTVNELKELNNLASNNLSIGQQLIVGKADNQNTYTVKSGDSLYSIARMYGTTVDELKRLNNKTSNLLSIGEVLNVPTTTNEYYTVVSGDTIFMGNN